MISYNYQIPKASKIRVTRHAHKRFLERFRLYFSSLKITSTYMWENVIMAQVSRGTVCYKWMESPFWVNKIRQQYGKVFVIKKNPCYYIVREGDNGTLVVITVVPAWFND